MGRQEERLGIEEHDRKTAVERYLMTVESLFTRQLRRPVPRMTALHAALLAWECGGSVEAVEDELYRVLTRRRGKRRNQKRTRGSMQAVRAETEELERPETPREAAERRLAAIRSRMSEGSARLEELEAQLSDAYRAGDDVGIRRLQDSRDKLMRDVAYATRDEAPAAAAVRELRIAEEAEGLTAEIDSLRQRFIEHMPALESRARLLAAAVEQYEQTEQEYERLGRRIARLAQLHRDGFTPAAPPPFFSHLEAMGLALKSDSPGGHVERKERSFLDSVKRVAGAMLHLDSFRQLLEDTPRRREEERELAREVSQYRPLTPGLLGKKSDDPSVGGGGTGGRFVSP
jgi:predicted  nucleic acid-binding Zn-ribbon protein